MDLGSGLRASANHEPEPLPDEKNNSLIDTSRTRTHPSIFSSIPSSILAVLDTLLALEDEGTIEMRDLALLQPALMNLAEEAPRYMHLAAEPLIQIWKLHPDLNISTIVSPTANLIQIHNNQLERRRTCYNNDIINENNSIGNGNGHSGTSASSPPPGALIGGIVGGVLGGILLLALIGLFPCIFLRRRRLQLQERHRQENLNRALKGASALGPHSRRTSRNVSPGMQEVGPGGYDVSRAGGARTGAGQSYAPVSPPITASTGGGGSPYTYGGGWDGGGSTNLIPQSRDGYYTHPAGVTGPQITNSVPGLSSHY